MKAHVFPAVQLLWAPYAILFNNKYDPDRLLK